MCEDAIIKYDKAFDFFVVAIKRYFTEITQTAKAKIKIDVELSTERLVSQFLVMLTNYALACEQMRNYSKMMECIRLAKWFA